MFFSPGALPASFILIWPGAALHGALVIGAFAAATALSSVALRDRRRRAPRTHFNLWQPAPGF